MSEERRDPEISEAELKEVSGGEYSFMAAWEDAKQICRNCPLTAAKLCDKGGHLRERLQKIYPSKIYKYSDCPYYQ